MLNTTQQIMDSDNRTKIIRLNKVPIEIHKQVRRYQLEKEEHGTKINIEQACIELIEKALTT